jgi:hypothetical protein
LFLKISWKEKEEEEERKKEKENLISNGRKNEKGNKSKTITNKQD